MHVATAKLQPAIGRSHAYLGIAVAAIVAISLLLGLLLRPRPIVRNDPPYKYGNRYMEAVIRNNWDGATAFCTDAATAGRAKQLLASVFARNGKLMGYGSEGAAANPPKTERGYEQPYTLIFQGGQVGIVVSFARTEEVNGEWKVRDVRLAPEPGTSGSGSTR